MRPAAFAAVVVALATAAPVGSIIGTVVDATTREPLAGANVVVRATDLGAACDPAGRFGVAAVPAGTYTVEASMIGYAAQSRSLVTVSPAHATEIEFRLSAERIQVTGVTVRAEHFPKVKDAPVSERTFSAEEVAVAPGGVGDIQRVVQAMPSVVSSGDQDNEVIVRGGNPSENLFLVDGVEIPYPNHFGSFFTQGGPINMLNALLVREVDFVAGAFPARYGNRTSSVMDVSLRRGSTREFDGNVDVGMTGLGVVLESPLPGRDNSFIGSYHKSFLELMAQMGVWGMSAVPYYDNALAKATVRLSPGNELSLLGLWGDDRIDIEPGGDVVDAGYWVRQHTWRVAGGVGLQTLFGHTGYGRLLVSGAGTTWDALVTRDSSRADTAQLNVTTEGCWGGRYDASLRLWPGHETRVGVGVSALPTDHRFRVAPETVYSYSYGPDSTVIDSTPLLDSLGNPYVFEIDSRAEAASRRTGAHIQHRLPVFGVGDLTVGLRTDRLEYTGDWTLSPRVGFSSRPLVAGIGLHGGWGIHHQEPQWYMLMQDTAANRGLRSRRSDHYVVGIERVFGEDLKLSVEGYLKRNSRLPFPAFWLTPDPYDYSDVYLDSGAGSARGLELFLQKKHASNWHGTLAYSFSRSVFENPQRPESLFPADYDYRHVVTASGTWSIEFHRQRWYHRLPGWFRATVGGLFLSDVAGLGARFRYMGGRPYSPMEWRPATRTWVRNYDRYNSERYPAYMRLDIRWDHEFLFPRWGLSWYFEIQNVLGRKNIWQYAWVNGDPQRQTAYQFGFWPVGGLVIQF
ncbi:TonB-dependent receptor [candidate division WOR-3 bacterium]|nr:TonB-dependent receptor [candidate division WOR-3 bacterium]